MDHGNSAPSQSRSLERVQPRNYIAPRTELEGVLAQIWGELLAVDRVGVHDSFFDLGGHSQLLVRLQLRLREVLKQDVPVTALFEYTTIDALGQYLNTQLDERCKRDLRAAAVAP